MTTPDGCHPDFHELGTHAPVAAACVFPKCQTAPLADSLRCHDHRNVRVSSSGSWVDDVHKEGGHG